jgi:hypothetical protein
MFEIDRNTVRGGKTVYGAAVGILVLDTKFPRMPGDIGYAPTWPFPVLYKVVRGASGERVTTAKPDDHSTGLLEAFLKAGVELVAEGADGLTTTCGFLSIYQKELAAHCGVPVAASSLMQIPLVKRLLPPGKRVGVLTFDASRLTPEHFVAAGAPPDTPVVGMEDGREFWRFMAQGKDRRHRRGARRHPGRRRKAGDPARQYRRGGARMHQHGAVHPRAEQAPRSTGVRHLRLC